jgi:hypothetical protein
VRSFEAQSSQQQPASSSHTTIPAAIVNRAKDVRVTRQIVEAGKIIEVALNESVRLKLLKDKCFEGQNSYGSYYLYSVEHDGIEKIIFLTAPSHTAIVEAKPKIGDEFILRKTAVQNGKKLTPQISIEFVERHEVTAVAIVAAGGTVARDNFRALLLQCLVDAAAVIRDSGIQMGNDEL